MSNTSTVADIPLRLISSTQSNEIKEAQQTIAQLSSRYKNGMLILAIRRTGCIACREFTRDLMQHFLKLQTEFGVGVCVVVKEVLSDDLKGFREYFPQDEIYLDTEDLSTYKALGHDGEAVKKSLLGIAFNYKVWSGIKRAFNSGVKNGSLQGDSTIQGGLMLFSNADQSVVYTHNEEIGTLPNMKQVFEACRGISQVSTNKDLSSMKPLDDSVDSETQPARAYCTDTSLVCAKS